MRLKFNLIFDLFEKEEGGLHYQDSTAALKIVYIFSRYIVRVLIKVCTRMNIPPCVVEDSI